MCVSEERHKRTATGLSGILSGFPFSDILFSSILSGIRFGLHRGNPQATTSISRLKQV